MNAEMGAPNVLTVGVDQTIVREFLPLCGGALSEAEYCTIRPPWNSDVRWISPRTAETFEFFHGFRPGALPPGRALAI